MDSKEKQQRGNTAASKGTASKKQGGAESPSPDQSATSTQNPAMVGAPPDQTSQQNKGSQQHENADGKDLMQQAKETTSEVVSQVQQRAGDQINRQKETAASELNTMVNAVRRFGETLNSEGNGPIARFAAQYGDRAANSLDRFARYLREQDTKRLLDDVQNFGRRQPALLIGGAFLLGFAGARVIKSSMQSASPTNTETQRWSNSGTQLQTDTVAGQQSFRTGISESRTSTSPNRI